MKQIVPATAVPATVTTTGVPVYVDVPTVSESITVSVTVPESITYPSQYHLPAAASVAVAEISHVTRLEVAEPIARNTVVSEMFI